MTRIVVIKITQAIKNFFSRNIFFPYKFVDLLHNNGLFLFKYM
jgi:hypothetical protein